MEDADAERRGGGAVLDDDDACCELLSLAAFIKSGKSLTRWVHRNFLLSLVSLVLNTILHARQSFRPD